MRHPYSRTIKRYIIATIMFIVVGYLTVFIKDSLDSRNPEASLPIISVTTGYTAVPSPPRAGFEWSFGSKTVRAPFVPTVDVPLIPYDALPDVPILVKFSTPPEQITLYEGVGLGTEEFTEKRYNTNTPQEDGVYVYKVVARFNKGVIVHYFALDVKTPYIIS